MPVTKFEIKNITKTSQMVVDVNVLLQPNESIDLKSTFSLRQIANFFGLEEMLSKNLISCLIVKDSKAFFFNDSDNFQIILLEARIEEIEDNPTPGPEGPQGPQGPQGPPGVGITLFGKTQITDSVSEFTVTFPSPISSANYVVVMTISNVVDATIRHLVGTVKQKTISGFTFTMDQSTDHPNYFAEWIVLNV